MKPWNTGHATHDPNKGRTPGLCFLSFCLYPWPCCVALAILWTLQDLWAISFVFSKFPDGCCWGVSCNHSKNHKSQSTLGKCHWGLCTSSTGPDEWPQAFLASRMTTDRLRPTPKQPLFEGSPQLFQSPPFFLPINSFYIMSCIHFSENPNEHNSKTQSDCHFGKITLDAVWE